MLSFPSCTLRAWDDDPPALECLTIDPARWDVRREKGKRNLGLPAVSLRRSRSPGAEQIERSTLGLRTETCACPRPWSLRSRFRLVEEEVVPTGLSRERRLPGPMRVQYDCKPLSLCDRHLKAHGWQRPMTGTLQMREHGQGVRRVVSASGIRWPLDAKGCAGETLRPLGRWADPRRPRGRPREFQPVIGINPCEATAEDQGRVAAARGPGTRRPTDAP